MTEPATGGDSPALVAQSSTLEKVWALAGLAAAAILAAMAIDLFRGPRTPVPDEAATGEQPGD